MVDPGPEVVVWLKVDCGFLIDRPPNEELQIIYWVDRKFGQIAALSCLVKLVARLEHCAANSTIANFTCCGGGWNHGMSDALRKELFETMRPPGLSELNNAGDGILCACP